MRNIFMVFPILWFIVVASIILKIVSGAARPHHPGKNVPPPNRPASHPSLRPKKNIHDKLNGEDQPKRGKLSRESRDDEKNWF